MALPWMAVVVVAWAGAVAMATAAAVAMAEVDVAVVAGLAAHQAWAQLSTGRQLRRATASRGSAGGVVAETVNQASSLLRPTVSPPAMTRAGCKVGKAAAVAVVAVA